MLVGGWSISGFVDERHCFKSDAGSQLKEHRNDVVWENIGRFSVQISGSVAGV